MRTLKLFLSVLFLMLFICFSAQTKPPTQQIYVSHFNATTFQEIKDSTLNYYKKDIEILNNKFNRKFKKSGSEEDKWIFNNNMLAQFFNNEINSFAISMKDLSLEENIVNVNTDNKTMTIGRNIILPNNKSRPDKDLRKVTDVISLGVSSSIDKNFSKIYSKNSKTNEYDFASEINFSVKWTHIGNNIIFIDTSTQIPAIKDFRANKIPGYLQNEIDIDKDFKGTGNVDSETVSKKYYEYYKKISEKEINNIKENKLFNSYLLHWYGFALDIPVTSKALNVKANKDVGNFESIEFSRWKMEAFGNLLLHFSNFASGSTLNFRLSGSLFNNNNFLADNSTAITFQTINDSNSTQQIISSEDLVFIGDYNKFITSAVKLEGSSLFLKNTVGISGAIEKNLGIYDALNWKLGIPVSLKDKEKKPTLNFELQWREVNKVHLIGLSAGFIFGKFVR